MKEEMIRYGIIREKNPREIVLLRGRGCRWRRCAFCDYHLDFSVDEAENFALNRRVLSRVTGMYARLEVINSGSFGDLDERTMTEIERTCQRCGIVQLHFECHYQHRNEIPALRKRFEELGVAVKIKQGVETFDAGFREKVLKKGIAPVDPSEIARGFDEGCLLFGLTGQTAVSMKKDIETGLRYFQRVCVNIMTENSTKIRPDPAVIQVFKEKIYPQYRENPRVDILFENTDFTVGGKENV